MEIVIIDNFLEDIIMGGPPGSVHVKFEKRYNIRQGLEFCGIRTSVDIKDASPNWP
jgi:hypothetical protein